MSQDTILKSQLWKYDLQHSCIIAGVDEVGRGALVGSVVAACVILSKNNPIEGLKDSKKLTAKRREFLNEEIQKKSLAFNISECSAQEIDQSNILKASLKAMLKAIESETIQKLCPQLILVDGNQKITNLKTSQKTIIKGDSISASIAAASIIAKVYRDNQMQKLDAAFPQYGFSKHKGYATKQHVFAIHKYGYINQHRKSFKVRNKSLDISC